MHKMLLKMNGKDTCGGVDIEQHFQEYSYASEFLNKRFASHHVCREDSRFTPDSLNAQENKIT
jgi:hypothetical protein